MKLRVQGLAVRNRKNIQWKAERVLYLFINYKQTNVTPKQKCNTLTHTHKLEIVIVRKYLPTN